MLAHIELLVGTAWYQKVRPHPCCEVGIRGDDSPGHFKAIATNLASKNPNAIAWVAIERSSSKTAGYVYCLDTEHQRWQVGTMLLAGVEIHANHRMAVRRNCLMGRPETGYVQAGFQQVSSSRVRLAGISLCSLHERGFRLHVPSATTVLNGCLQLDTQSGASRFNGRAPYMHQG